jgi:hypothetical protein
MLDVGFTTPADVALTADSEASEGPLSAGQTAKPYEHHVYTVSSDSDEEAVKGGDIQRPTFDDLEYEVPEPMDNAREGDDVSMNEGRPGDELPSGLG